MMRKDDVGREKKGFSRGGMFAIGFLLGILLTLLILAGITGYFMKHPQQVLVKVADYGIQQTVKKTAGSMPRDYIGARQDDIAKSAQQFAQAFSENKITQHEMGLIGRQFFLVMADQKITPDEIDRLLRMIDQYAR
jgi:hypothetical protein